MNNDCLIKNLTLYEASAGSGKTFTLVSYYLQKIIYSSNHHNNIIAVTFTNKAVNELKTRILDELYILSNNPKKSKYLNFLLDKKQNCEDIIFLKTRAQNALFNILHNYDSFTVTTIDSFFKGIVSALYNEINLFSDYTIELNTNNAIDYTIDNILNDKKDIQTANYLAQFAINKLLIGNSWNIKEDLKTFIKEIFSGFYMHSLSSNINHNQFDTIHKDLLLQFEDSKNKLKNLCNKFLKICRYNNIEKEDFPRGLLYNYISLLSKETSSKNIIKMLDSKTYQDSLDTKKTKFIKNSSLASENIITELLNILIKINETAKLFLSYFAIKENIYIYFILHKSETLLNQYRSEKKVLFIPDLTFLLNKLTNSYALEFIYEKVGTKYEHYLIDEFQDTSIYQWQNFKPLIKEAVSNITGSAIIVGDPKQSIYRWREASSQENINDIYNSFNSTLQNKTLATNYRSSKNIIYFNNAIFTIIPKAIKHLFNSDLVTRVFKNIQQIPAITYNGHVDLEFINNNTNNFIERTIEKTISEIKNLQDIGYSCHDIAILVRNQKQVELLSTAFLEAARSDTQYNYNFISDDGLCLSNFTEIRLLISIFKLTADPNNILYYTEVLFGINGNTDILQKPITIDYALLPKPLSNIIKSGFSLTLYNYCREIINILKLDTNNNNNALDSFQNIILNFGLTNNTSICAFLKYWEQEGKTQKLKTTTNNNAINILTIHKAKGLEFKAVIIPFCSWDLDENILHNSSKILWTKLKENYPLLPVSYKSYLKHTIFKNIFEDEKNLSILDSINMLYVAFTRSINHLKILCPKPKNEQKLSKVSDLLFYIINNTNDPYLDKYYDPNSYKIEIKPEQKVF